MARQGTYKLDLMKIPASSKWVVLFGVVLTFAICLDVLAS
jgi:hypothetical protein